MFLLRLAGLLLLTAFCYGMGSIPSSEANGIALFFGPLFFVVAPLLYFLPTIEGALGGHKQMPALVALNLLGGWTGIGWVGALVWALTAKKEPTSNYDGNTPEPSWMRSQPANAAASAPPKNALVPTEKTCPFCAETIKAAASTWPSSQGDSLSVSNC